MGVSEIDGSLVRDVDGARRLSSQTSSGLGTAGRPADRNPLGSR